MEILTKLLTQPLSCKKATYRILNLLIASTLLSQPTHAQDTSKHLIPRGLIQLGNGHFYSPYAIVVDKKARTLTLWKQNGDKIDKVLEFPSDMGKKEGNKSKLGDHRTPEGIYFVQKKLNNDEIPFDTYGSMAFTLDYPNIFDKRAGKTGYGIWIHAVPDTETLERGSRGCVVVRNDSIKELEKYISPGKTPVLIFNSTPYAEDVTRNNYTKEIEGLLAQWIQSWQAENIDQYMSFYSSKFYSLRMNFKKWRLYKTELNEKYSNIQVNLYSPTIFEHQDGFIVKALQAYHSSEYTDFGEKTLYLQKTKDGLKIIAEEWVAVPDQSLTQNLAKCCFAANTATKTN